MIRNNPHAIAGLERRSAVQHLHGGVLFRSIERLSEEHATVKALNGSTSLEPGDRVRIIPNHSCVVSNLVDAAWLVDGDNVTALPIAARGKIT